MKKSRTEPAPKCRCQACVELEANFEDAFLASMDQTIRKIAAQEADLPDQPPGIVEASRAFLASRAEKKP